MINRECLICKTISLVRKDGAGKLCRSCRAKENSKNNKPLDISGIKYGKLTCLSISHTVKKLYYWNCICDCGNKAIISGSRLRSGHTKSCGCIVATQKGLSTSPTYRSWQAMIQRCYDSKIPHYKRYGAIGIIVCDRWKNSFLNFLEDMGERPDGKTLDRINSSGNYELNNCRWLTYKQQGNNRRGNLILEAFGKKQTLQQWSDEYKVNRSKLRKRIFILNWEIEKALTYKR